MDSTIIAAFIGAIATVIAAVLVWVLPSLRATKPAMSRSPDKDDIYFMQHLLHDAYDQGLPLSARDLAEHHLSYAPLEVEVKMIRLEQCGLTVRISRPSAGLGLWQLSPTGVQFMLAHGHQLYDLVNEQRVGA